MTIARALKSDDQRDSSSSVYDRLTRDQIVGSTVEGHGGRHRVERVSDTTVTQVENGNDEENGTGVNRLFKLIDELVIPKDLGDIEVTMVLGSDPTGFGPVPEIVSALPHSLHTSVREQGLEDFDSLDEH